MAFLLLSPPLVIGILPHAMEPQSCFINCVRPNIIRYPLPKHADGGAIFFLSLTLILPLQNYYRTLMKRCSGSNPKSGRARDPFFTASHCLCSSHDAEFDFLSGNRLSPRPSTHMTSGEAPTLVLSLFSVNGDECQDIKQKFSG